MDPENNGTFGNGHRRGENKCQFECRVHQFQPLRSYMSSKEDYLPRGLISADRSKISYGIPALSRSMPRNIPPRPAPAMRTRGGLPLATGDESLPLKPPVGIDGLSVLLSAGKFIIKMEVINTVESNIDRENKRCGRVEEREVKGMGKWDEKGECGLEKERKWDPDEKCDVIWGFESIWEKPNTSPTQALPSLSTLLPLFPQLIVFL